MNYETKADTLEASFGTIAAPAADPGPDMTALRSEVARLSVKMAAMSRPVLSGTKGDADPARAAFTERYLRKGLDSGFATKSLSETVGSDGGVAIPQQIDAIIDQTLIQISPIRKLATVVAVGTTNYSKLIVQGGIASGWVPENGGRALTGTPNFISVAPPMGELYANPAATQAMLDDAMFDVETWLAGEIATEFARAEGVAFVTGSGVSRPKGFLTYATAANDDSSRPFGTLQYLPSGAAGAFASTNPQDKLVDLVHSLRTPYRQGSSWVMNSAVLARIRKMKDNYGGFIWQPALAADQPATLLGYPVIEADAMPDLAPDSVSIAFGNFKAGYLIAERPSTAVLRDPFTNKPFVQFYATRRLGGAVINSEAIKLLKFAAS